MILTLTAYFKNKAAHDNASWLILAGTGNLVVLYKGETFTSKEFYDKFPIHADKIHTSLNKTFAADNPDKTKRWITI